MLNLNRDPWGGRGRGGRGPAHNKDLIRPISGSIVPYPLPPTPLRVTMKRSVIGKQQDARGAKRGLGSQFCFLHSAGAATKGVLGITVTPNP